MTDSLLIALSRRRSVTWQRFKFCVSSIVDALPESPLGYEDATYPYANEFNALAAVGHVVGNFSSHPYRVHIAPRVLARLPTRDMRAVLVGHRLVDTESQLREACELAGASLISSSVGDSPLKPQQLVVIASSEDILADVADYVGAIYNPVPPSWQLLHLAGTVQAYKEELQWRPQSFPHNWPRRYFDRVLKSFTSAVPEGQAEELVEITNPSTNQHSYVITRNIPSLQMAAVERDLAKYSTLSPDHGAVLYYRRNEDLLVPAKMQLPALLHTAMGLCSGIPPRVGRVTGVDSALTDKWYSVYPCVPFVFAQLVASKLNQSLAIDN